MWDVGGHLFSVLIKQEERHEERVVRTDCRMTSYTPTKIQRFVGTRTRQSAGVAGEGAVPGVTVTAHVQSPQAARPAAGTRTSRTRWCSCTKVIGHTLHKEPSATKAKPVNQRLKYETL
jgi:hypothetical protein